MKKILLVLTTVASALATPLYNVQVIPPPPGYAGVDGWAINAGGVVTGAAKFGTSFVGTPAGSQVLPGSTGGSIYYDVNDSGVAAFSSGNFGYTASLAGTILNNPAVGFPHSRTMTINNAGISGGSSLDNVNGGGQATLWDAAGNPTLVSLPSGWTNSIVSSINNAGRITGTAFNGTNIVPFVGTVGSVTPVAIPGGTFTTFTRINDVGDLAGASIFADGGHAWFLPATGGLIILPDGASDLGGITALNNRGELVGQKGGAGFIWDQTMGLRKLNDLVPAGWNVLSAIGINDSGQIVAQGFDPSGRFATLRLDPVPEPGTWLLSCAGLALVAWRRRSARVG